MRSSTFFVLFSLATLALVGCASGRRPGAECVTSADCPMGRCMDGVCVAATDGGPITMFDAGSRDGGGMVMPDTGPPVMCTTGAECDDLSVCTTDDCTGGVCANTPIPCDDGNPCTDDACDPTTGCASTPSSCDDANACTVDSCDPSMGCAHAAMTVPGGSCAMPIDISAGGTFTGDSTCASSDFTGVCLGATGPDVAFVLNLAAESDVTLDARATSWNAVLFVGGTCGDGATACDSDGMPSITTRLSAGRHHVGLDGRASTEMGAFSLAVAITPVVRDELLTFPQTSDTHYSLYGGGYYWNAGDYIQGARTTGLASITSADLTLSVSPNGLTCGNQNMQLRINGTIVGPVTIMPGATSFTRSYTFGAIAGPTYTIRLETVTTVTSGCGAAGFPDGVSTLRIRR